MAAGMALFALFLFQAAGQTVEGQKALERGDYAAAAEAFRKAVEADPQDYAAQFHLALANTLLNKPAEAMAGYEKVLELKPGVYEAELNLGILLVDRKQPARAAPLLKSAVEKKPEEFRPNYYLAEATYDLGDDAGAERYFTKAAELDPKDPGAQVGLGRAIFNQGRYDEAARHYRRAVELDARYREVLIELASRFEEKGRAEEAIGLYREFPDDPAVQERLGHLLLATGKPEEAIDHLLVAVNRSPTAANRYALATAYLKTKQPDRAAPLLELTLQDQPHNFDLRMTYGRLLRDRRDFAGAAREFLQAAREKPGSGEAWSELAGMLILLENYPQALAALDRLEALGNAPVSVHFFRGLVLDKTKQYEPALASYERFLAASNGAFPDEEFKARQRVKVIKKELRR